MKIRRSLRHWLLRRLKPCSEIVPLMSESLDHRLNACDQIEMRLHLLVCAWCARYLKQIKFLSWATKRHKL